MALILRKQKGKKRRSKPRSLYRTGVAGNPGATRFTQCRFSHILTEYNSNFLLLLLDRASVRTNLPQKALFASVLQSLLLPLLGGLSSMLGSPSTKAYSYLQPRATGAAETRCASIISIFELQTSSRSLANRLSTWSWTMA